MFVLLAVDSPVIMSFNKLPFPPSQVSHVSCLSRCYALLIDLCALWPQGSTPICVWIYIPHSIFHLVQLLYVRLETFGPTLIRHLLLLWQHSVLVEQSVKCSGDLRMMLRSPEHQQNSPLCKLTLQSREGSSICTPEKMHMPAAISALSHKCDYFSHHNWYQRTLQNNRQHR
jgi:hypothetical protein